ncbi:glutaredoxin-3 [Cylas formicarius]|uniref:glutaredoxin-3 n=1 Tax=Cylas formicarius TaxID=197179 RepID=UPI0029583F72|nr:glutaredoxin-3 [Cylas formicarius]
MPLVLKDDKSFIETIKQLNLVVIHFEAEWAEQCTQVNELLDAVSKQKEFSNVKFYSCPAEDLSEISLKYKIEAVPTVILFKSGEQIDRVEGADATKITESIKKHNVRNEVKENEPKETLEEMLKALINRSKVMLFMKGDRVTPKCGFSRQMIEILNNAGVAYDTFDILTDEEVRQGLKTYSDWPTYPQLYVNGDLIGGLDIVKEMVASNELQATLNG